MWQPIETAPKDGTVIDLWVKSGCLHGGHRECFAEFRDGCWQSERWNGMDVVEWLPIEFQATHWMPVPAPPTTV